jgi:hypothetical protein
VPGSGSLRARRARERHQWYQRPQVAIAVCG